jgi:hypothetical protein
VWLPPAVALFLFATSAAAWRLSSAAWWTTCTSTTRGLLLFPVRRWRRSGRRKRKASPAVLGQAAWDRLFRGAGHPLFLAPLLVASLIGYPARMGSVVLAGVAALLFAIYAFLVWFFVWFGLDRVGVWVLREVRNDALQIVQGVAGGLPLLLVFAVFFALTAETWEVVVETDTREFLLLIGLLVALTIGVLFLLVNQQLQHAQRQLAGKEPIDDRDQPDDRRHRTPWKLVQEQALREEPARNGSSTAVIEELFGSIPQPSKDADLSPGLERRGRANALIVIAVYQGLVLVPAGISALLLFWAVGRLAVDTGVAAEWIHGDNAGKAEELLVDRLSFWREPWTRVPVVLAAFSVLSLTVTLLTNREHRTYFFAAASAALRQRLAVRVAYRVAFDEPAPVPEAERETAGATAAPQPQPAAEAMTITPGAPLPGTPGA